MKTFEAVLFILGIIFGALLSSTMQGNMREEVTKCVYLGGTYEKCFKYYVEGER